MKTKPKRNFTKRPVAKNRTRTRTRKKQQRYGEKRRNKNEKKKQKKNERNVGLFHCRGYRVHLFNVALSSPKMFQKKNNNNSNSKKTQRHVFLLFFFFGNESGFFSLKFLLNFLFKRNERRTFGERKRGNFF